MNFDKSDLSRMFEVQCKLTDLYRKQLNLKDCELKKAHSDIQLIKGILTGLKSDLNLKEEQFNYLFGHILEEDTNFQTKQAYQDFEDSLKKVHFCVQEEFKFLPYLSPEILLVIFSFLDFSDLANLAKVNRECHRVAKNENIWKGLCVERWGSPGNYDSYSERHKSEMKWFHSRPVISTLKGHTGSVTCISYNKGSSCFVSGSDDSSLMLWSLHEPDLNDPELFQQHHFQTKCFNRVLTLYGHGGPVWCCTETQNGEIVSGSYDKTIKVWNKSTSRCEYTLRGHSEWVSCVDSNQRAIVSGSWDASLKLWDLETKQNIASYSHVNQGSISCLEVNETHAVTGCRGKLVETWDLETGVIEQRYSGHKRVVNAVKTSETYIFSGSADTLVKQWDLRTARVVRDFATHKSHVMCLDFDLTSNRLATGSYDKSICIWDLRKPDKPRQVLKGHSAPVFCLEFDDHKLLSGSCDQTVKIWNFSSI